MSGLNDAVLKTLVYADIFDFPLTETEIHHSLIALKPYSPKAVHLSLLKLLASESIVMEGEFFALKGRFKLFKMRQNKAGYSGQKSIKAQRIAQKVSSIPGISAVFLTGAVAVGNADRWDDIDIMVVSRPGLLWTMRVLVQITLSVMGVRRYPGKGNHSDLICPNLFLDESSLTVPTLKQDLYTAHEVIQARFLAGDKEVAHRFLTANSWVKKFLPNIVIPNTSLPKRKSPGLIEKIAYRLQIYYMRSKRTRELVTPGAAYFHPRDTSSLVLKSFNSRCLKLGLG